jgi:hypothetical protein
LVNNNECFLVKIEHMLRGKTVTEESDTFMYAVFAPFFSFLDRPDPSIDTVGGSTEKLNKVRRNKEILNKAMWVFTSGLLFFSGYLCYVNREVVLVDTYRELSITMEKLLPKVYASANLVRDHGIVDGLKYRFNPKALREKLLEGVFERKLNEKKVVDQLAEMLGKMAKAEL